MTADEPLPLLALFAVGLVSGALNVVAGGGSFLTLPTLIFLGLPTGEANGTNRLGVLAQNLMGVWGYHRASTVDWRWARAVSVPSLAGAAVGAWWALQMSDFAFRRLLALAMLGMTLWTLLARPKAGDRNTLLSPWHPGMVVAFLLIGLYGGLIQAGVGFAVLAATSIAGMNLVQGNAVKVLAMLAADGALPGDFLGRRRGPLGARPRPRPWQRRGGAGWRALRGPARARLDPAGGDRGRGGDGDSALVRVVNRRYLPRLQGFTQS